MLRGVELEKAIINQKVQRSATVWCKYIFPKQFLQILHFLLPWIPIYFRQDVEHIKYTLHWARKSLCSDFDIYHVKSCLKQKFRVIWDICLRRVQIFCTMNDFIISQQNTNSTSSKIDPLRLIKNRVKLVRWLLLQNPIPNDTDIHDVDSVRRMIRYLTTPYHS
jgi:hypothetical protein